MEELKQCPFCGEEGVIIENIGRSVGAKKKYHAACNNDKCGIYGGLLPWYRTKQEAIAAWNRRVNNNEPS